MLRWVSPEERDLKPAPFMYFAPRTLDEALDLLARHGTDAKILAGGQSLVPLMNMRLARPAVIVDVNRIAELGFVRDGEGALALGALTRQRVLERDPLVRARTPLLAEAAPVIGHIQTRTRGTVGGSLAHADPAAELPACMVALDATFHLASARGRREVQAADFYQGLFTIDLAPDEMLVEARIRHGRAQGAGSAFVEVARRYGDFALVGAATVIEIDGDGVCRTARLVFLGAGNVPHRVRATEALIGRGRDEAEIEDAARAGAAEVPSQADIHASAEYRRRVARELGARALAIAWSRAAGEAA